MNESETKSTANVESNVTTKTTATTTTCITDTMECSYE